LFEVFDKIKKLNGNLFHFGKCTKAAHNSKDNVVDLIRDSTIYVSIYLWVQFMVISEYTLSFEVMDKSVFTMYETLLCTYSLYIKWRV